MYTRSCYGRFMQPGPGPRDNSFTQIQKALYEDAMFLFLWGAQINMAAGNQQKHLLLSFPTYAWIHCLRNS